METESELNQSQFKKTTITILCCMCGIQFNPAESRTNICLSCLSNSSDITEGITKSAILNFCRMCKRYNRPPWVYCERESRELLSLCLKKIKGLNKLKIVEAAFIWTEPHSRRIKVKLTVSKEVMNNTSMQQSFVVEFVEHYMQCDDCKKEFTPHTWGAVVQLRQKVEHKKTFLFIEQMILKHNVHEKVLKVEDDDDGLNFYYKNKSHAMRLVDFLQSVVPTRLKPSRQLISNDEQNAIANYKFGFSLEIPRICKEDMVVIPKRLCKELGGCGQILFCYKVTTNLHMIDPISMKRIDITPTQYFHYEQELQVLSIKNNSTEFLVIDCEKVHNSNLNESYISSISNMFIDKIIECQVLRTSDYQTFNIKTHLAGQVRIGASMIGYDLTKMNLEEFEGIKNLPDLILVKRIYPESQGKKRIWKLKRLEKDGVMVEEKKRAKKKGANNENDDLNEWMDELEHDRHTRAKIDIYKDEEQIKKLTEKELKKRSTSRKQRFAQRKVIKVGAAKKTEIIDELDKDKLKKKNSTQGEEDEFEDVSDDDDDDEDQVKLAELMNDLKIEDHDDQPEDVEDDPFLEDFISKIDKVKIEADTVEKKK